mmetsp:Transcript_37900/g.95153  ORF Transcript_37900/g.95153 Transcript_37900/m.95153 type:complete len:207 (+) Transcript_37900:1178-1798(+)
MRRCATAAALRYSLLQQVDIHLVAHRPRQRPPQVELRFSAQHLCFHATVQQVLCHLNEVRVSLVATRVLQQGAELLHLAALPELHIVQSAVRRQQLGVPYYRMEPLLNLEPWLVLPLQASQPFLQIEDCILGHFGLLRHCNCLLGVAKVLDSRDFRVHFSQAHLRLLLLALGEGLQPRRWFLGLLHFSGCSVLVRISGSQSFLDTV